MTREPRPCSTADCGGNSNQTGAAGGLCPRCYQRKRRGLPPRSHSFYRAGEAPGIELKTIIEAKLARAAKKAAKVAGLTVSSWIRDLILAGLGGGPVKKDHDRA